MNLALQNNNAEKKLALVKKRALYYLGKREYSRKELHEKITPFAETLELSRQQINQILSELENKDWLSDKRFTDQFIFSKKKSLLKKNGIRFKDAWCRRNNHL